MLTQLKVPYVGFRDRLFVLGDAAFNLANMFGQEVRRPMADGFLSPAEQDAIPMMRFIIHRLLGDPKQPGEKVCFCIPAPSIDKDNDTVYHEGIVSGILRKLGYTFKNRRIGDGKAKTWAPPISANGTHTPEEASEGAGESTGDEGIPF